jgi:hypothetical protein
VGNSERTCRDHGHAVIHLGRFQDAELGGVGGIVDDVMVEDFVGRHLPLCCCYRRPPGQQPDQAVARRPLTA